MPEDCLIGFRFFEHGTQRETYDIVNQAAVDAGEFAVRGGLYNRTALDNALPHLGTASDAVQSAAFRKNGRFESPNDADDGPRWDDGVPPGLDDFGLL